MHSPGTAKLVGLDIGSTTTQFLLAEASIAKNCATGRMELGRAELTFAPPAVFTPFREDLLDEAAMGELLAEWVRASGVTPSTLFGGSALVTGLAARRENVVPMMAKVREIVGPLLLACTEDAHLESWLAFRGNCDSLLRANPITRVLNLDIGGGTTNWAIGNANGVSSLGCLFVGARHFQFRPGTYELLGTSAFGRSLLKEMSLAEVAPFYRRALEAITEGDQDFIGRYCALLEMTGDAPERIDCVTLSGGVGQLVYGRMAGRIGPSVTPYGDLGLDLAEEIVKSPVLRPKLTLVPQGLGRATVYGLTLHQISVSGTSLFLPETTAFPLLDLPVLGTVAERTAEDEIVRLMGLSSRAARGSALFVSEATKAVAERLGKHLGESPSPLVLLLQENLGKTFGNWVTGWGKARRPLYVLDEVAAAGARFVSVGSPAHQVIPISLYGGEN